MGIAYANGHVNNSLFIGAECRQSVVDRL